MGQADSSKASSNEHDSKKIKKNKLVVIQSDEYSQDDSLGETIDQIYEEFQGVVNAAMHPINLNLHPLISRDYILSKLGSEYLQTLNEYEALIVHTRQKMAICRNHHGYLPDLQKVLINAKDSLIALLIKMDKVHLLISERALIISPAEVNESVLINARTKLMSTLDNFMLNFCLIKLEATDPNTPFY